MPHTQHLGAEAWGGMWLENSKCIQPSSISAPWVIGAVNIWKTSSPVITLASYLLQQHGCLESPVVAKTKFTPPLGLPFAPRRVEGRRGWNLDRSRKLEVASWSLLLLQQGRGSSESNTVIFHVNLPQAPGGILERSWKQIRRDANCKTCYYDYLWRLDTLVELPRDRLCRKDFQTPSGWTRNSKMQSPVVPFDAAATNFSQTSHVSRKCHLVGPPDRGCLKLCMVTMAMAPGVRHMST